MPATNRPLFDAAEAVERPGHCRFCDRRIYQPTTGRPRQYCDSTCRRGAWEARQRAERYTQTWQQLALAAGWRPPEGRRLRKV